MAEPFLGEIRMVGFEFAPKGWAMCNGQLLPISQNAALFALLGTTYGGDGQITFSLPDPARLDSVPSQQHAGSGASGRRRTAYPDYHGNAGAHAWRRVQFGCRRPNDPDKQLLGRGAQNPYAAAGTTAMSAQAVAPAGSGNAHENMPPFLVLNFIIALQGIFPSRN